MLSDRFVDSSLAYQGGAGGLGIEAVRAINAFGIGDVFPDRTLVLTLDEGAERARARDAEGSDRIGGRSDDYHRKVAAAFHIIAAEEPRAGEADRRIRHAGRCHAAAARRHPGPAAVIVGQDRAVEQFAAAWASRKLHHAWLLAGPKGVGKASFAHAAARRVLADAAGPPSDLPGIDSRMSIRSSSWSKPAAIPTCAGSSAW